MVTKSRRIDRVFGRLAGLTASLVVLCLGVALGAAAQEPLGSDDGDLPQLPASLRVGDRPRASAARIDSSLFTGLQEPAATKNGQQPGDELSELERVMQQPALVPALEQPVSTVSRQESTVGHSPAAVFVVTNEMIRRSGATSIPEVLRMVPGVDVARIDSNKWAIGIRGFNNRFAGKLLIQVDGRAVYTPLFAGTYWDVQDVLLQDVDRIEVIRGPGATVWGENAVNGIINILTKHAKDTQGGLIFGGGGTDELGFSGFRYGGKSGDDLYYRVWGKWFERGTGFDSALPLEPAGDPNDEWRQVRGGFRFDWEPTECDQFTLQADIYDGNSAGSTVSRIPSPTPSPDPILNFRQPLRDEDHSFGGEILTRWSHKLSDDTDWMFQFYWDHTNRNARFAAYELDTIDFDFQYRFPLGECHKLIWGAGYRLHSDEFQPGVTAGITPIEFDPRQRDFDIVSTFLQDEITLIEDLLSFTAGTKLSVNDFTDLEVQPTARLLLTPTKRQSLWASVSRAVRTPSRVNHDITLVQPGTAPGVFPTLMGNRDFDSEEMIAYELGYRAQPTDAFSWDVALFFNNYDGLQVQSLGTTVPPTIPLLFANGMDGEAYGVELSANYKVSECWRLYGAYTFLQIQLHRDQDLAFAADPELAEGQSPQNQVYLQSSWDLPCDMEFDVIGRYVDRLTGFDMKPNVDSYISLDVRLGWKPCQNIALSVVGQNLLDSSHREFHDTLIPGTEVQRGVYGMIEWRF